MWTLRRQAHTRRCPRLLVKETDRVGRGAAGGAGGEATRRPAVAPFPTRRKWVLTIKARLLPHRAQGCLAQGAQGGAARSPTADRSRAASPGPAALDTVPCAPRRLTPTAALPGPCPETVQPGSHRDRERLSSSAEEGAGGSSPGPSPAPTLTPARRPDSPTPDSAWGRGHRIAPASQAPAGFTPPGAFASPLPQGSPCPSGDPAPIPMASRLQRPAGPGR